MGVKGFAEGGIASIVAGCTTHPLDLIKVRMQLQGEAPHLAPQLRPVIASFTGPHAISIPMPPPRVGPVGVGIRIVQQEGVSALFSGVSATVLRAALYSTTRMGLYDVIKQNGPTPPPATSPSATRSLLASSPVASVPSSGTPPTWPCSGCRRTAASKPPSAGTTRASWTRWAGCAGTRGLLACGAGHR